MLVVNFTSVDVPQMVTLQVALPRSTYRYSSLVDQGPEKAYSALPTSVLPSFVMRAIPEWLLIRSGLEKTMPALIQRDAGQLPGGERAGVDIDPVWQYVRCLHRGMAVHDNLAKIHCAAQKLVADP
jgi:hypothetical protein